jgi:cytochrome c-type biogenesis protein CcmH/NrfG
MMLNRERLGFWIRLVAIALAAIFLLSFVLMGIGSDVSYNLFGLLGGSSNKEQEKQESGADEQIARAQEDLEENPEDLRAIRRLAGLYLQSGQTDSALEVLQRGREVDPEDPAILLYLGQAQERRAQGLSDEEERRAAFEEAGDAYVAAAELRESNSRAYLSAGAAYEQAGEKSKAIRYWNDYLKREPEGEGADAVTERIDALLKGGQTTGDSGDAKK